jgi:hypothetical protein
LRALIEVSRGIDRLSIAQALIESSQQYQFNHINNEFLSITAPHGHDSSSEGVSSARRHCHWRRNEALSSARRQVSRIASIDRP